MMMKRNLARVGLVALILCLFVVFTTGCAKKAALKEEAVITKEQKPVVTAPAVKAPSDDQAARERALREQALRDQAAREAAAREAAAREAAARAAAAKEAEERAKREAAAKAAAILTALQIPNVHFDFDKSNLKPEAKAALKAAAPAWLKYRDYKLVVEGHCDERGTIEYNLALGERRATEAAKFLMDLGIEKERIKTISYGKEMPLDKRSNEEAWAKNRRAQFVIFPPPKQ
jgi:peptidoglycan-associated lipoprotein